MTPMNPSTSPRAWVIVLAKREARDRRSLTPFQRQAWREVARVGDDMSAERWLSELRASREAAAQPQRQAQEQAQEVQP